MRGYLIGIIFCIIEVSSLAFGANEIYYRRGVSILEIGMDNLREFKQVLNTGLRNQLVGKIREKCGNENRLSYFLNIFKMYYPDSTYTEATCLHRIYTHFIEARKEFDKAINMDNTFVDAYLLKAYTSIKMGDYSEALQSFEKAKSIGIENVRYLNPFEESMKDLFYSLADEVMRKRLSPPKGRNYEEWAKEVIELFMGWRKNFLDKEIKKIDKKIDEVNNSRERRRLVRKKRKIETQMVNNYFELVRFYIKHHLKGKAEEEFNRLSKEVRLSAYPGITEEIKDYGYGKLKEVKLEIDDKEDNALANEFKKPVRFRFFMDDAYFSCDYLRFSFLPSGCKVEFKDELSCELFTQPKTIYLNPEANLTCEIILPEIAIKEEDKLPFYVTIDGRMPSHLTRDGKLLDGPTSFEIILEEENVRRYPRIQEEYRLVKDENDEWTILESIKKGGRNIQEKFEKNKKFTSKIIISPFSGKRVKICKATWPIPREKKKDRLTTGLFILLFFLR